MEKHPDNWLEYEKIIYDHFVFALPDATVTHNARLNGNLSKTQRQIDILVSEPIQGMQSLIAVDAKFHNRPIDVKHVEEFLGLLADVKVDRGIMVSKEGYSAAAYERAFRDDVDLDLDIWTLDDFTRWQGPGALPYSGQNAVLLPAPLGWVVDGERRPHTLGFLYRRGLAYETAHATNEFIYFNILSRTPPIANVDDLISKQNDEIKAAKPDSKIFVSDPNLRRDYRTRIRRAEIPDYPTAEITGFVEFNKFIFFAVLFTPLVIERRNTRKLHYIMLKVLPLLVRDAANQSAMVTRTLRRRE